MIFCGSKSDTTDCWCNLVSLTIFSQNNTTITLNCTNENLFNRCLRNMRFAHEESSDSHKRSNMKEVLSWLASVHKYLQGIKECYLDTSEFDNTKSFAKNFLQCCKVLLSECSRITRGFTVRNFFKYNGVLVNAVLHSTISVELGCLQILHFVRASFPPRDLLGGRLAKNLFDTNQDCGDVFSDSVVLIFNDCFLWSLYLLNNFETSGNFLPDCDCVCLYWQHLNSITSQASQLQFYQNSFWKSFSQAAYDLLRSPSELQSAMSQLTVYETGVFYLPVSLENSSYTALCLLKLLRTVVEILKRKSVAFSCDDFSVIEDLTNDILLRVQNNTERGRQERSDPLHKYLPIVTKISELIGCFPKTKVLNTLCAYFGKCLLAVNEPFDFCLSTTADVTVNVWFDTIQKISTSLSVGGVGTSSFYQFLNLMAFHLRHADAGRRIWTAIRGNLMIKFCNAAVVTKLTSSEQHFFSYLSMILVLLYSSPESNIVARSILQHLKSFLFSLQIGSDPSAPKHGQLMLLVWRFLVISILIGSDRGRNSSEFEIALPVEILRGSYNENVAKPFPNSAPHSVQRNELSNLLTSYVVLVAEVVKSTRGRISFDVLQILIRDYDSCSPFMHQVQRIGYSSHEMQVLSELLVTLAEMASDRREDSFGLGSTGFSCIENLIFKVVWNAWKPLLRQSSIRWGSEMLESFSAVSQRVTSLAVASLHQKPSANEIFAETVNKLNNPHVCGSYLIGILNSASLYEALRRRGQTCSVDTAIVEAWFRLCLCASIENETALKLTSLITTVSAWSHLFTSDFRQSEHGPLISACEEVFQSLRLAALSSADKLEELSKFLGASLSNAIRGRFFSAVPKPNAPSGDEELITTLLILGKLVLHCAPVLYTPANTLLPLIFERFVLPSAGYHSEHLQGLSLSINDFIAGLLHVYTVNDPTITRYLGGCIAKSVSILETSSFSMRSHPVVECIAGTFYDGIETEELRSCVRRLVLDKICVQRFKTIDNTTLKHISKLMSLYLTLLELPKKRQLTVAEAGMLLIPLFAVRFLCENKRPYIEAGECLVRFCQVFPEQVASLPDRFKTFVVSRLQPTSLRKLWDIGVNLPAELCISRCKVKSILEEAVDDFERMCGKGTDRQLRQLLDGLKP